MTDPLPAVTPPPARDALAPASRLVQSLQALTRAHPVTHKLLVGPDLNFGRELLVTLARHEGGWVGWEAMNLRAVADALAFVPLADRALRVADDIDVAELVAVALEAARHAGALTLGALPLLEDQGYLRAMRDAVLEARMGAVTPAALRAATARDTPARDVAAVLAAYEQALAAQAIADPAMVFQLAVEHIAPEAPHALPSVMALVPGLSTRGWPGRLLHALQAHGAITLDDDAPGTALAPDGMLRGVQPSAPAAPPPTPSPTIDMFAAATPADELREVARRVLTEGWRWDQVEIVATDPESYGVALDALVQSLGVGATMLQGLPLARTRVGRAIHRWLQWLEEGLPADLLREALQSADLRSPSAEVTPLDVARELRTQRIGWGRARYEHTVTRLAGAPRPPRRREDESDEEHAARAAQQEARHRALVLLLESLLAITPPVPERGGTTLVLASPQGLAAATLSYLDLLAIDETEAWTVERISGRLTALVQRTPAAMPFSAAMAALREYLDEVRAWPAVASDRQPWNASGGLLHLTDLAHAGVTGRPRVFVVGLDADRAGGPMRQDPLLPDAVRLALRAQAPAESVPALPTTAERRAVWRWRLDGALAALRGRVTLSYAVRAGSDGRESGAAPVLLQAWRRLTDSPAASYHDLHTALQPLASPVPGAAVQPLDARDVWLAALADGPVLRDGTAAVHALHPGLAAGSAALAALLQLDQVSEHHGCIPEAGPRLDPTRAGASPVSPSALETLAACPLRWFYRHGLSVRAPDDPVFDPDAWLEERDRGSLLHEIFERFTRAFRGTQHRLAEPAAESALLDVVEQVIAQWRERVPPPADAVFHREAGAIRQSALAFLRFERGARAETGAWHRMEFEVGGPDAPVSYPLVDGSSLPLRGRVDRVDQLPSGALRVIDYKTGAGTRYERVAAGGPFKGGRQLQPALYASAIAQTLAQEVAEFEYVFPTMRGRNASVVWPAADLASAREVVTTLVSQVRAGTFVPTADPADCGWCDYRAVCRVHGEMDAPLRAQWAAQAVTRIDVYAPMRQVRAISETDDAGEDEA